MAKTSFGEIALTALGALALGGLAYGAACVTIEARKAMHEEYVRLVKLRTKLERKPLTILVQREYDTVQARIDELEDALGLQNVKLRFVI